jgi:hypothetical protein
VERDLYEIRHFVSVAGLDVASLPGTLVTDCGLEIDLESAALAAPCKACQARPSSSFVLAHDSVSPSTFRGRIRVGRNGGT